MCFIIIFLRLCCLFRTLSFEAYMEFHLEILRKPRRDVSWSSR